MTKQELIKLITDWSEEPDKKLALMRVADALTSYIDDLEIYEAMESILEQKE